MDGKFLQLLPANLGIPCSNANSSNNKRGKQSDNQDNLDQPSKKKAKAKLQIREGEEKGNQVINSNQPHSLKMKPSKEHHSPVILKQQLQRALKWPNSTRTICANWSIIRQ